MSTQIQLRSWVAGLLVCLFPTCVAAADAEKPELKPDQLVVSAQVLDNNGVTGQVLEVDWVHPFTPGFTFVAGGYYSEIGDARLAFGRVGGGGSVGKWTSIEGALDLGKVREQPVDYDYRVARIYITQLLVPGKLDLLIEDRFLDIGQARGNLLKVGFGIPTWSVGTVGVAYQGTTSGNLDSWAATLRYDFRLRRIGYLAGFSVGRAITSSSPLLPALPTASSSEVFAGVRIPIGDQELMLLLDSLGTGDARRNSLFASVRIRL